MSVLETQQIRAEESGDLGLCQKESGVYRNLF
jgi:hypothetical protein